MRLISSEYLDGHTIPGKLIFNYFGNSMNANFRVERDKLYLIVKGASWGTTFILSSAPDTSTKEMGGYTPIVNLGKTYFGWRNNLKYREKYSSQAQFRWHRGLVLYPGLSAVLMLKEVI